MRINFQFLNFKQLYIHFCFLALLNIFFSTEYIQAKTFSINDIEISTPFEIDFNKNEIIDKGFTKAFDQLILSIVQTKDKKKLGKTSLNTIKGMIETFSIQEEKFIDEKYYLTLNVSFNKTSVFGLLESKNIFPSLPIKKNIFFIPVIYDENRDEIQIYSNSKLFNNWNSDIKKHHLLNYILPTEDLEDLDLIKTNKKKLENYDFKEIIKKYNLDNYIIMIVFKNKDRIKVLNKINLNNKITLKSFNLKSLNLNNNEAIKLFTENIKTIYENEWKFINEINTSVKLSLTVLVKNDYDKKISEFEKTLKEIEFIYDFYIIKFNNKHNIYKIVINCSPDLFLKIMKKKNFIFNTQNQIWILE